MITREEAADILADREASGVFDEARAWAAAVVALYDEIDHLRHDLERYGLKTVGRLEEPLSDRLTAERDAALAAFTGEAAVSLMLREERDAARLEIRRLRAAEAPGTDDEAFEGTGWTRNASKTRRWTDEWTSETMIVLRYGGRWYTHDAVKHHPGPPEGRGVVSYQFALDAMRAAVPGSV